MRRSSKPLPQDPNQRAAEIARRSTEETEEKQDRSAISIYLAEIGRAGGLKGGKARAEKLTGKKRRAIAPKAANARWAKEKKVNVREITSKE